MGWRTVCSITPFIFKRIESNFLFYVECEFSRCILKIFKGIKYRGNFFLPLAVFDFDFLSRNELIILPETFPLFYFILFFFLQVLLLKDSRRRQFWISESARRQRIQNGNGNESYYRRRWRCHLPISQNGVGNDAWNRWNSCCILIRNIVFSAR